MKLVISQKRWRYNHKGIDVEISSYDRKGKAPFWAYYLYIPLTVLPVVARERLWIVPEQRGGKPFYDFLKEPLITEGIRWHAGGPSFYEKIEAVDHRGRMVKIGCDLDRPHDQNICYDLEDVEWQAELAVDSVCKLVFHAL